MIGTYLSPNLVFNANGIAGTIGIGSCMTCSMNAYCNANFICVCMIGYVGPTCNIWLPNLLSLIPFSSTIFAHTTCATNPNSIGCAFDMVMSIGQELPYDPVAPLETKPFFIPSNLLDLSCSDLGPPFCYCDDGYVQGVGDYAFSDGMFMGYIIL